MLKAADDAKSECLEMRLCRELLGIGKFELKIL